MGTSLERLFKHWRTAPPPPQNDRCFLHLTGDFEPSELWEKQLTRPPRSRYR